MAARPLLIKKYGNRRLYDTEASRYITLEELAQLIRGGRDVRIIDAKTKADLTKSVLLQIIAEQEKEQDLLPVSFLKKMIQLGDDSMRESLPRYLTFSLDAFFAAQKQFEKRYQHLAGSFLNPMAWLAPEMARAGVGAPPQGFGPPFPEQAPEAEDAEPEPAEPPAEEPPADAAVGEPGGAGAEADKTQIEALKAQVEQIQALLAKMATKE